MTGQPAERGLGRAFWTVWTAGTVSYAGDGVVGGAMPLLAASLTRDARLISLVDALTMLGWVLLGLVSGVVVDRVEKLALMGRVDLVRGLVMAGFAALVLTGHVGLGLLYATSLLLGLAAPFFDNAASSVVPELVADGALERANSVTQASLSLASNLVGPPLGATLFVVASGAPFVVDAASFVLAGALVLAVSRSRPRRPPVRDRTSTWTQLTEGVRFLVHDRVLRTLAIAVGVVNAVLNGVVAVLVLYVLEILRLPEAAFGWVVAAFAVGGLLGAAVAPVLTRRVGQRGVVMGSLVLFGVAAAALGLTSDVAVVVVILALGGLSGTAWNVVTLSYRQRAVPGPLLGRVTSAYRMLAFVAIPVGAAGAGLLAHAIGIQRTYVAGGVVLLVMAALVTPALRGLPARATGRP